jgi:hypothetical protein
MAVPIAATAAMTSKDIPRILHVFREMLPVANLGADLPIIIPGINDQPRPKPPKTPSEEFVDSVFSRSGSIYFG